MAFDLDLKNNNSENREHNLKRMANTKVKPGIRLSIAVPSVGEL